MKNDDSFLFFLVVTDLFFNKGKVTLAVLKMLEMKANEEIRNHSK